MKLVGSRPSPFTRKVRIVLAEKKIDYDFLIANPWDDGPLVTPHNPLGKVPVLVLEDQTSLYDSRVIVEFLDNVSPISRLIPQENRERIEVRRWESLADGVVDAAILVRYENLRPRKERSPAWIERQMGKIGGGIDEMERNLGGKGYCTGHSFNLADIAAGVCLDYLDFRQPGLSWRDAHPNLARLQSRLGERQSFIDTVPAEA